MRGRMRVGSGHMSVRKACVAAQFLRPSQRCAAGFGERLCTHAQRALESDYAHMRSKKRSELYKLR